MRGASIAEQQLRAAGSHESGVGGIAVINPNQLTDYGKLGAGTYGAVCPFATSPDSFCRT